jgi:hypothetical protein
MSDKRAEIRARVLALLDRCDAGGSENWRDGDHGYWIGVAEGAFEAEVERDALASRLRESEEARAEAWECKEAADAMLGEEIAAHAKATEGWRLCAADLAAETKRANAAEERAEESEATRSRLAAILTETASALRGPPAPLSSHGWADLPERVRDLRASLSEAREALRGTADHRLRDGSPCWCANHDETLTNSDAWKHAPRCRDARALLARAPVSKGGAAATPEGVPVRSDWKCEAGTEKCPGNKGSLRKDWICGFCGRKAPPPKSWRPAPECRGESHDATAPHPCPTRKP